MENIKMECFSNYIISEIVIKNGQNKTQRLINSY